MTTDPAARDDLFTHIHKALRLGLFDLTAQAGRTDWTDPDQVSALTGRWRPLLELLRAHTAHEEQHILRILDAYDPAITEPTSDQHHDLDDLLDDLAQRFDTVSSAPDPHRGLSLYRDLARFVAAYLPHLHDEETRIMARIWDLCSDQEIAATRARFMADTTLEVTITTLEYLLPAIDRPTRQSLIGRLAATGPAPAVAMALQVAERVLGPAELAEVYAAEPGEVVQCRYL